MNRLLCVVIAASAAACGSDGVSIDGFDDAYLDAYCEYQVRCQYQPSVAACKASEALNDSTFLTVVDGVRGGTISYDEEQAGACIDEIRDASCAFEGFHTTSACSMFTGNVDFGGACFVSAECASDASCVPTDANCDPDVTCCPGTCGMGTAPVPAGGTCGENDTCVDGTYCKPGAGDTGTCTALITSVGAACDSFVACANPMICDVFAASPTCIRPAGSGEMCDLESLIPCADSREYCDPATMKCAPAAAVGASCATADCVSFASCINDTCQADVEAGGTCSDATPDCLGSLECTNGTCQLEPAGMSCL